MADKEKPKRRLKPAQSVREKAQQTKSTANKPKRISKFGKFLGWPFKKVSKFLGKYKIFRFLGRIIVPKYLRSSWQELKLVTWPDRHQTKRLTYAVLAFAIALGTVIALLDYGLSNLFKVILLGKH